MSHLIGSYDASGPIIDVWIGVSEPRARALSAKHLPVPSSIRVPFLIDTGADTTMVNEDLMRSLGIPATGARDIVGSTTHTDPTTCDCYAVAFELRSSAEAPMVVPALEVLARPFFNVSIYGLIGRDVLDRLHLTMGGRRFRLDWGPA